MVPLFFLLPLHWFRKKKCFTVNFYNESHHWEKKKKAITKKLISKISGCIAYILDNLGIISHSVKCKES